MKPGQLFTYNGTIYRAKRRTNHCYGCDLNKMFGPNVCPNIVDSRNGKRPLTCAIDNIVFKKV